MIGDGDYEDNQVGPIKRYSKRHLRVAAPNGHGQLHRRDPCNKHVDMDMDMDMDMDSNTGGIHVIGTRPKPQLQREIVMDNISSRIRSISIVECNLHWGRGSN